MNHVPVALDRRCKVQKTVNGGHPTTGEDAEVALLVLGVSDLESLHGHWVVSALGSEQSRLGNNKSLCLRNVSDEYVRLWSSEASQKAIRVYLRRP